MPLHCKNIVLSHGQINFYGSSKFQACYLRFFAVNDDMQKSRFSKESFVASHKICFFIYFKSTLKQI